MGAGSTPALCTDRAISRTTTKQRKTNNMGFLDQTVLPTNNQIEFIGIGESTLALVSLEKGKTKQGAVRYEAEFLVLDGGQKDLFVKSFFDVNNANYSYGPEAASLLMSMIGALHNQEDAEEIKKLADDRILSATQPARGLVCKVNGTPKMTKATATTPAAPKLDAYGKPYLRLKFASIGQDLTPEQRIAFRKQVEEHKLFRGTASPVPAPAAPEANAGLAALGL